MQQCTRFTLPSPEVPMTACRAHAPVTQRSRVLRPAPGARPRASDHELCELSRSWRLGCFRLRLRHTGRSFMRLFIAMAAAIASLAAPAAADTYLLRPARVFDGVNPQPHAGWSVLVEGDKIAAVGPNVTAPARAKVVDLPGETLTPGLIEGHS